MPQVLTPHNSDRSAIIGLGANLLSEIGPPSEGLRFALKGFEGDGITIRKVSHFYTTPCFPKSTGPDFVNAVASIDTSLTALGLLARLHRIESDLGRVRKARWGPRLLDLDLLVYGDEICPDRATYMKWFNLTPELQRKTTPKELILPHPRLHERGFVLVPLAEIAPDWQHPVLKRSAAQLLAALDASEINQIQPLSSRLKDPK